MSANHHPPIPPRDRAPKAPAMLGLFFCLTHPLTKSRITVSRSASAMSVSTKARPNSPNAPVVIGVNDDRPVKTACVKGDRLLAREQPRIDDEAQLTVEAERRDRADDAASQPFSDLRLGEVTLAGRRPAVPRP